MNRRAFVKAIGILPAIAAIPNLSIITLGNSLGGSRRVQSLPTDQVFGYVEYDGPSFESLAADATKSDSFTYYLLKKLPHLKAAPNKYNTAYIVGDINTGKTKLLKAYFHYFITNVSPKACYLSAESLMNHFVMAARKDQKSNLQNKISSYDLVIIDDFHFLGRAPAVQKYFDKILDQIILENKTVVVASEKYPSNIEGLQSEIANKLLENGFWLTTKNFGQG